MPNLLTSISRFVIKPTTPSASGSYWGFACPSVYICTETRLLPMVLFSTSARLRCGPRYDIASFLEGLPPTLLREQDVVLMRTQVARSDTRRTPTHMYNSLAFQNPESDRYTFHSSDCLRRRHAYHRHLASILRNNPLAFECTDDSHADI